MAKTRNNKRQTNKRQKTSNNKRYAGIKYDKYLEALLQKEVPPYCKTNLTVKTKHEPDGDVASKHVKKIYGKRFPWRNRRGDKQGDAARRRQDFANELDLKAYLETIRTRSPSCVPLPNYLNGIKLTDKQTQKIEKEKDTYKRNKTRRKIPI